MTSHAGRAVHFSRHVDDHLGDDRVLTDQYQSRDQRKHALDAEKNRLQAQAYWHLREAGKLFAQAEAKETEIARLEVHQDTDVAMVIGNRQLLEQDNAEHLAATEDLSLSACRCGSRDLGSCVGLAGCGSTSRPAMAGVA